MIPNYISGDKVITVSFYYVVFVRFEHHALYHEFGPYGDEYL